MDVVKTYKFKLKLTSTQKITITQWMGTCCYLYNVAKEVKEWAYKSGNKTVTHNQLCKQLTEVRKEFKWVRDVPAETCQEVLERLDTAFKKFFTKTGGYPKWAKKEKYKSITFKSIKQEKHNRIILPKIGSVKYFDSQKIEGDLRRASITKEIDGYYIFVTVKQNVHLSSNPGGKWVGIDVGLSHFAVTSDGKYIDNPQYYKNILTQLRIKQRALSRKQRNSSNRLKQKNKIGKLHLKTRRQRYDFIHKLTHNIVEENGTIVVERLNIENMMGSPLSLSISDVAWGEFHRQLAYKSLWRGKCFIKVDSFYTSQQCSKCGYTNKENRKTQNIFKCLNCKYTANADYNAANVILGRGTSELTDNAYH